MTESRQSLRQRRPTRRGPEGTPGAAERLHRMPREHPGSRFRYLGPESHRQCHGEATADKRAARLPPLENRAHRGVGPGPRDPRLPRRCGVGGAAIRSLATRSPGMSHREELVVRVRREERGVRILCCGWTSGTTPRPRKRTTATMISTVTTASTTHARRACRRRGRRSRAPAGAGGSRQSAVGRPDVRT